MKVKYSAERMTQLNELYTELAKTQKGPALIESFLSNLTEDEQADALEHITISWANKPFPNYRVQNAKKPKITSRVAEAVRSWKGENAEVIELKDMIRVKFPDIPTNSMRAKMKERGLSWVKEAGAWQGPLTSESLELVKRIAGVVDQKAYLA